MKKEDTENLVSRKRIQVTKLTEFSYPSTQKFLDLCITQPSRKHKICTQLVLKHNRNQYDGIFLTQPFPCLIKKLFFKKTNLILYSTCINKKAQRLLPHAWSKSRNSTQRNGMNFFSSYNRPTYSPFYLIEKIVSHFS